MDRKNKISGMFRFNVIDVLLIIVILFAGAVAAYMFTSGNNTVVSDDTVEITYKIRVQGMNEEFRHLVSLNDKVVDSVGLFQIGEVVDLSYSNTVFVDTNSLGEFVYSDYPEKLDMVITVKAHATVTEGAYMIGGYSMAVGTKVSFRVPDFTGVGYCTEITVKS